VKGHNLYSIIPYKKTLLKFSEAVSARAYYKNHYIDLMTGDNHPFEIEGWIHELDFPVYKHEEEKRFIHLFYELGFLFEGLSEEISSTELLAIDIQYSKKEITTLDKKSKKIILSLVDAPNVHDYEKQFMEGYRELQAGNCYQFNLTGEYNYSFEDDLEASDFIAALWGRETGRGAYGSATYVEYLDQLFLSNSPECLFQYSDETLTTRPIKGTLKRKSDDQLEIAKLWRELASDKKSQGELYMITDLLRNDLSRIDLPCSVVVKKKAPLLVPGLIHQFSEIEVKLRPHITLKNILEKIFPGGSITGAPKKRVMQILKQLEKRSRGFYCGSTLIFSKDQIEASINIRSSVVNFKNSSVNYQAGGGITLLSQPQSEFDEMTYKHDSYIDILTL
jgi:anthranilate/para-aminobenzoate synthase component I